MNKTTRRLLPLGAISLLLSCSAPNTVSSGFLDLQPEPIAGYVWKYPDSYFSREVEWRPGTRHSGYPHAQAGAIEGEWLPDVGYAFLRATDFASAAWSPGQRHSGYPHAQADTVEGDWLADPGYVWARAGDLTSAVWSPGRGHPTFPHIYAGTAEQTWMADSGYTWASYTPGDLRVIPIVQPATYSPSSPSSEPDVGRIIVHEVARRCAQPQDDDGFWATVGRFGCAITREATTAPGG